MDTRRREHVSDQTELGQTPGAYWSGINGEGIVDPDANVDVATLDIVCVVPSCGYLGTIDVVQKVQMCWPSGRMLLGTVSYTARVCERHFEDLTAGRDVS